MRKSEIHQKPVANLFCVDQKLYNSITKIDKGKILVWPLKSLQILIKLRVNWPTKNLLSIFCPRTSCKKKPLVIGMNKFTPNRNFNAI